MTCAEKWLKRDDLVCEELEGMDEVAYLDPDDGSSFALNTTASAILELCDGKRTAGNIADIICAALPAERQQVLNEVHKTLEELAAYGLIRTA